MLVNPHATGGLTLPMLRLLSPNAQWCKDFWKPSKPSHAGTHWIALAENSQMSTHVPGFSYFQLFFLHHHVMSKLATNSIRVNTFSQYKMMQKYFENTWNPGKWVLISQYSVRAIQWIPTWQDFDGFQKSLPPCALDESSLSIEGLTYLCR